MCEPTTIIAGTALALQAGSTVAGAIAQNKNAKANAAEAERAKELNWKTLGLREQQEQAATTMSIMQADRQAREAHAMAAVSAGESGVAGASVEAMLGVIEQDRLAFKQSAETNLTNTIDQLQLEKRGADAAARNRIAQTPKANPWLVGFQIGAAGLDFASQQFDRKARSQGKGGDSGH